eukprot:TRINITY_DN1224_c0_g1_i1.p1 TRINITY_DN1224_c0_g1~~TRINITY_DN1224_c0_g1_i1.p1  ORF type:complete len:167 (+),score=3.94 TRINITY_DN1224_c0_g1_i1:75-575(+)
MPLLCSDAHFCPQGTRLRSLCALAARTRTAPAAHAMEKDRRNGGGGALAMPSLTPVLELSGGTVSKKAAAFATSPLPHSRPRYRDLFVLRVEGGQRRDAKLRRQRAFAWQQGGMSYARRGARLGFSFSSGRAHHRPTPPFRLAVAALSTNSPTQPPFPDCPRGTPL